MRHGAILNNSNSNVYAKFDDDGFWNEKALVLWKSDYNKNANNKNNNVGNTWGPGKTDIYCQTCAQPSKSSQAICNSQTKSVRPDPNYAKTDVNSHESVQ